MAISIEKNSNTPLKLTKEQKETFTQYVLKFYKDKEFYEKKQINIKDITNNITHNPQIVLEKLLINIPPIIIDGVTINSSLFLNSLSKEEKQNFVNYIKSILVKQT